MAKISLDLMVLKCKFVEQKAFTEVAAVGYKKTLFFFD